MEKKIHVHFLGIGGSGASAIAAIAQAQGFYITGCDQKPYNEFTKSFPPELLATGHSPKHLEGVDILAVTPAVFSADPNNEELQAAKKLGIRIMTWQEFMGEFLEKDKFVIAVCGTHGKSTTTAMIGLMLEDAMLDPTVELGAIVPRWGRNYRIGRSQYFVTEADEFNNNFLVTHPDIAVITSIEMDHPEFFPDFSSYKQSFYQFLSQTKQKIVANLQDPVVKEVIGRIKNIPVIDYSQKLITFPLKIPGEFNILNASAAFQVGLCLNLEPEQIQKTLENYQGIGRRFEKLGYFEGATIYSDYGHHPTEIKVTLQALRQLYPKQKLILIYQPHMFSRTKALWDQFKQVLKQAPVDQIYLLDIFYAREKPIEGVTSKRLAEEINLPKVRYLKEESLIPNLANEIKKDDVIFFMGAGPIHELAKKLLTKA